MSFIRQLPIVIEKNVKRIVRSPLSLTIIFLGPFIVLLIINSAYEHQDSLSMNIGLIMESDNPLLQDMRVGLEGKGTTVRTYTQQETCVHDIQWGYNDACVLMGLNGGKPSLTILMDYSEINFVPIIIGAFNDRIAAKSSGFREQALKELSTSIQGSLGQVQDLKASLDEFSGENSPMEAIDDLTDDSAGEEFQDARRAMSTIDAEAAEVYNKNERELNGMLAQVNDLERRVDEQLSVLRSLRAYGQSCDDTYLPSISQELSEGTPESVISTTIQEYGKCKCVEYYQDNLNDVEQDLTTVRSYLSDVRNNIADAKERNYEFISTIRSTTFEQSQTVGSMESQTQEAQERLREFSEELERTFDDLRMSMGAIEGGTASLLSAMDSAQNTLQAPVEVHVESILPDYNAMVFLFPILYFFILIFITLIFSATFANSEHSSTSRGRNILSPLRPDANIVGMFITLLSLIVLQAVLLLILGTLAFHLPLIDNAFLNIIILTAIVTASYVLIGICIGSLFRSQILVMFSAIGVLIISFVYADIVLPLKMLSPFAQTLAGTNPFSIGIETVKQFLLFNTPFDLVSESLPALVTAIVVPFVAAFILFSWRRRRQ